MARRLQRSLEISFELRIRNERHVLEFVTRLDASAVDYQQSFFLRKIAGGPLFPLTRKGPFR